MTAGSFSTGFADASVALAMVEETGGAASQVSSTRAPAWRNLLAGGAWPWVVARWTLAAAALMCWMAPMVLWARGVAGPLTFGKPAPDSASEEFPWPWTCPNKHWVLGSFGSGHWILDHTDDNWAWYMEFLGVNRSVWPDEFNASDIHQYVFTENGTFIMNHTIPKTGFHLLFQAGLLGKWEKNPYPTITPGGFDNHSAKVNLSNWRNALDAGPTGDSCSALRTEMPIVVNDTQTKKQVERIVVFWRELVSPTYMKASLHVLTPEGDILEPWRSHGLSYRYFRKTVQSFGDAARRLKCVPTGKEPGTLFC